MNKNHKELGAKAKNKERNVGVLLYSSFQGQIIHDWRQSQYMEDLYSDLNKLQSEMSCQKTLCVKMGKISTETVKFRT